MGRTGAEGQELRSAKETTAEDLASELDELAYTRNSETLE